ncbi:potassium voltage-gated channel subfamily C member 3-like [Mytilus trossulus]|uniref:potassium voltage-gated channel subfamily C member 3-like n=1 Tax=Mytilus trossulus TaxID=6551 RepID=UPI003004A35D
MANVIYTINNKGDKFEISTIILDKITCNGSSAGKQIISDLTEDKTAIEFNFHRHQTCTSSILDFVRGDLLHIPADVCPKKFRQEMEFWGIPENEIATCCFTKYQSFLDDEKTLRVLQRDENTRHERKERVHVLSKYKGWKAIQAKMWQVMEYPSTSIMAKIFMVFSNLMVMLSLFILVASTSPMFFESLTKDEWEEYLNEKEKETYGWKEEGSFNVTIIDLLPDLQSRVEFLDYLEWITIAYFTIEIICRIFFFPLSWKDFLNFFIVVDTVSLIVMYVDMIANVVDVREKYEDSFVEAVNSLQIIRVLRLFRLLKHVSSFRILVFTIRASLKDLLLMLLCLLTAVLIFSSMAYFTRDAAFTSIPQASWWAIVTLTTVGYGDIVPKTLPARLVASACAVIGVCMLAILIPSLVNNFMLFNSQLNVMQQKKKTKNEAFLENSVLPVNQKT